MNFKAIIVFIVVQNAIRTCLGQQSNCGCEYGDYVMLDEQWSHKFWPQRTVMGYAYYQQGFSTFAEMLDWSSANEVDFGWKEGSSYGQLFYRTTNATTEVTFDSESTTLLPSSSCWNFESNDFDSRMAFVRKDVLETHPAFTGTAALLEWQKCDTVSLPVVGAKGDPHITTWRGETYDFHGICDLVLLSNPGFDSGLGMYIHIRNRKMRQWSFIETAAVSIGEDILQIVGGTDSNKYILNRDAKDADSNNSDGVLDDFGGYKLKYQRISDVSVEYEVVLKNRNSIVLKTWNGMVSVQLNNPLKEDFDGSLGLLGSYPTGAKVARDKKTIISDLNEFGQEWQVIDTEPKLFIESKGPQFPTKCQVPKAVDMRRRLATSSATIEMAKTACSSVAKDDKDLCIFDVLATNNIDVAGAY